MSLHGGQCNDIHYKICSERHYTKIVSIVADISSDVHYIYYTLFLQSMKAWPVKYSG